LDCDDFQDACDALLIDDKATKPAMHFFRAEHLAHPRRGELGMRFQVQSSVCECVCVCINTAPIHHVFVVALTFPQYTYPLQNSFIQLKEFILSPGMGRQELKRRENYKIKNFWRRQQTLKNNIRVIDVTR
jgi:hypothetical protein